MNIYIFEVQLIQVFFVARVYLAACVTKLGFILIQRACLLHCKLGAISSSIIKCNTPSAALHKERKMENDTLSPSLRKSKQTAHFQFHFNFIVRFI